MAEARASVPIAVREDQIAGEGWRLDLAPGWLVRPATPPGHWTLVRDRLATDPTPAVARSSELWAWFGCPRRSQG